MPVLDIVTSRSQTTTAIGEGDYRKGQISEKGHYSIIAKSGIRALNGWAIANGVANAPYTVDFDIVPTTLRKPVLFLSLKEGAYTIEKVRLSNKERLINIQTPFEVPKSGLFRVLKVEVDQMGDAVINGEFHFITNDEIKGKITVKGVRAVIWFSGHWPFERAKDLNYSLEFEKQVWKPINFDFNRQQIEIYPDATFRIYIEGEVKREEADFFENHYRSIPYILVLVPVFFPATPDGNEVTVENERLFFWKRAKFVATTNGIVAKIISRSEDKRNQRTTLTLEFSIQTDKVYPLFPFLIKSFEREDKGEFAKVKMVLESYPWNPVQE